MSGVWFYYTKVEKSCFWCVHDHVHLADHAHDNWCYLWHGHVRYGNVIVGTCHEIQKMARYGHGHFMADVFDMAHGHVDKFWKDAERLI